MKGTVILLGASLIWLNSCAQNSTETESLNDQDMEPKTELNSSNSDQTPVISKRVSKAEFTKVMNESPDAQLIDVRTPGEYTNGKINDAVNIDFFDAEFENNLNKLDKTKLTLIYCQSGGRSAKALSKMKELGFVHVLELEGGYSRW